MADWVPLSEGCVKGALFSETGDVNCLAGADASSGPGALFRGGAFGSGTFAGVFAVDGRFTPSGAGSDGGFRAAR